MKVTMPDWLHRKYTGEPQAETAPAVVLSPVKQEIMALVEEVLRNPATPAVIRQAGSVGRGMVLQEVQKYPDEVICGGLLMFRDRIDRVLSLGRTTVGS